MRNGSLRSNVLVFEKEVSCNYRLSPNIHRFVIACIMLGHQVKILVFWQLLNVYSAFNKQICRPLVIWQVGKVGSHHSIKVIQTQLDIEIVWVSMQNLRKGIIVEIILIEIVDGLRCCVTQC